MGRTTAIQQCRNESWNDPATSQIYFELRLLQRMQRKLLIEELKLGPAI